MKLCYELFALVAIGAVISSATEVSVKAGGQITAGETYSNDTFESLKTLIAVYDPNSAAQQRLMLEAYNQQALILPSDKTPVDVLLRRTYALLAHIEAMDNAPSLQSERAELDGLKQHSSAATDNGQLIKIFERVKAVRRRIAFKNPLLNFDAIIFLKHNKMARGERHMVDQYLGCVQDQRGGVYVLEKPFSSQPELKPLLAGSKVLNGRLKGRELHEKGAFISLELDYDAKHIYFAFTEGMNAPYAKGGTEKDRKTARPR
ncbi:MAG: hypothetical protein PHO37_02290 [Kiritimatiellae bacterium]|nr:hypothetical protein [Kiritimatiellia bacterium]